MKGLVTIIVVILSAGVSFGQTGTATGRTPQDFRPCIAKEPGATISIQKIFSDPVLHICGADVRITSFDLSWTSVTGKEPEFYAGPYTMKDSAITGKVLSEMKSGAAHGTITRIYIDQVKGVGADGSIRRLNSKSYKVTE